MGFFEAVRSCLSNYATFSGRARRSEFWWFAVFVFLGNFVFGVIDSALFGSATQGQPVSILGALFSLAMVLPYLAVGVRRLHDRDLSGWWMLLLFVPVIGALILLFFFVQPGTEGENRHGRNPVDGPDPMEMD